MIRRSTSLVLFRLALSGLAGFTVVFGPTVSRATVQPLEDVLSERGSSILLAQQGEETLPPGTEPASPENPQPAPFSVDPTNSTDTGTAVPDISNPQARPAASSLQSAQQAESVRTLQEQLQQRGYYEGPVDGIFGPGTQRAVETLQQEAGLPSTGEIDIPTLQELVPTNSEAVAEEGAGPESEVDSPQAGSEGNPEDGADVDAEGGIDAEGEAEAVESGEPQDSDTAPTGNSRQWLWPGIALIAALGSFGLGFVLFNRGKDEDEVLLDDTAAWGAVSPDLPIQSSQGISGTAYATDHAPARIPEPASSSSHSSPIGSSHNGSAAIGHNGLTQNSPALETAQSLETTRLPKVNIIDELIEDLAVPDPARRRKAIWELGQRGNSTAVQPLVNSMVGADSREKSLILAALSEIGIRSLKPMNRALAIALQDDNPEVRKNAIRDLTRIYDLVAQISQMLGHATEDEDPEVRQTANWALEQLGRIRKVPELKQQSLPSLDASPKPAELLPGDRNN